MSLKVKIGADASSFMREMDRVDRRGATMGDKMVKAGKMAGVGLAAIAAGATVAAYGIARMVSAASTKAAGMESLTTQFEVLTKSASKSRDLLASFREEAIKSPLSVSDYANAGKTLMAFGISAENTLPILKMLGDVSMGNADRFGSLALAFAQTQAAGRLMGQEVLQFVNAGFNPLQEISRKTGRSMIELKKAMEDGAISADMVTDAFRSATAKGGLFFGALEKGSATTEGKLAKVRDAVEQLQISFGTGFNEGLKVALDATNEYLPRISDALKLAGDQTGMAISEAIAGDMTRLVAMGSLVGEAIGKAIAAGVKYGLRSLGENIIGAVNFNNDPNVRKIMGDNGVAMPEQAPSAATELFKRDMQDLQESAAAAARALQQMAPTTATVEGMGGSKFRYAREGENSSFRDSTGRMLVVLETIARNTKAPTFATQ